MQKLLDLVSPNKVPEMIAANYNHALMSAALHGHLPVIQKLYELASIRTDVRVRIDECSFSAFLSADRDHRLSVIQKLLDLSPRLLADVESHGYEFSKYTQPFISQKLQTLRIQKSAVETNNPQAIFDVSTHEAQSCFYILRNLIRQNSPLLHDDILFLLNIPAVKALAHTAVTPNMPNELLRLARTLNNQDAAAILLDIPAVRTLAEQNNYYRAESQGRLDLHTIAQDRESSMRALSTGEQKRLNAALKRYQPEIKQKKVDVLFQEFRDTLAARYNVNPARLNTGGGREIALPLTWVDWCKLRPTLSADTQARALQAYHLHKEHTALRYISKPNDWMAANAAYVNVNPENAHQRWSTFEEYKPLITLFWMAAKDQEVAPTDGFTVESRVEHFIDELAHLGRAHNWDISRIKTDAAGTPCIDQAGNPIEEEFDDGRDGDKPSCYSGVKRRLFQSVLGHPLLKILTSDDIKQELREFVREHFQQHITNKNRDSIRHAWETLCVPAKLSEIEADSLDELNISAAKQAGFLLALAEKYPAQFNDEPEFRRDIENSFKLNKIYEYHAARFAAETALDTLLMPVTVSTSSRTTAPHASVISNARLRYPANFMTGFKKELTMNDPRNLTKDQLNRIDSLVQTLQNERKACGQEIGKRVKSEHIEALETLKELAKTMPVYAALQQIETDDRFRHVNAGTTSRTHRLMDEIRNESIWIRPRM